MHEVIITTSENKKYFSKLDRFQEVYCYPKEKAVWNSVSIDSHGIDLVWSCRFELHIDQIVNTEF